MTEPEHDHVTSRYVIVVDVDSREARAILLCDECGADVEIRDQTWVEEVLTRVKFTPPRGIRLPNQRGG